MAYVSKEDKAKLSVGIKAVLKKFGMKGSISVRNGTGLVVKLKPGPLDILGAYKQQALDDHRRDRFDPVEVERLNHLLARTYIDVNNYYISESFGEGKVTQFLTELKDAMEGPGYFNHDDGMTDYFHRSHYTYIYVGQWDKPYTCTGETKTFEPVELQVYEPA